MRKATESAQRERPYEHVEKIARAVDAAQPAGARGG